MVSQKPAVTSRDMYYIHFLANLAATEGELLSDVCPLVWPKELEGSTFSNPKNVTYMHLHNDGFSRRTLSNTKSYALE